MKSYLYISRNEYALWNLRAGVGTYVYTYVPMYMNMLCATYLFMVETMETMHNKFQEK